MNIVIQNTQKSESFALIFQHMKLFTEFINIMFEKDRLYIQAMDNNHISILELNIPAGWFDVYEHTNASTINIAANSSILQRILGTREKTQSTNIQYKTEESDRLFLHFTGEDKTEFDKHFEIPLMEVSQDLMSIPEMDYQADFSISSTNFANIISQLKKFGDNLEVQCSEQKIMLSSSTAESGKMNAEIGIDELSEFSIEEGETVKLNFSIVYLYNICQFNKLAKDIDIHVSNEYPMKIVYKLYGSDNATMVFYLAPKMDEE